MTLDFIFVSNMGWIFRNLKGKMTELTRMGVSSCNPPKDMRNFFHRSFSVITDFQVIDSRNRYTEMAGSFSVAVFFSVVTNCFFPMDFHEFFGSASWAGVDLIYFCVRHFLSFFINYLDVHTSYYNSIHLRRICQVFIKETSNFGI